MKFNILVTFIMLCGLLKAQNVNYAKEIIGRLSSTQMSGRGYVNNGISKAAKYIEKEFKQNGAAVISQWFTVAVNTFPSEASLVINNTSFEPGVDFIIEPSSCGLRGIFNIIEIKPSDIISGIADKKLATASPKDFLLLNIANADSLNDVQKKTVTGFRDNLKKNVNHNAAGIIEVTSGKLTWGISSQCIAKPWIITNRAYKPCPENKAIINIRNRYSEKKKTRNIIGYCKGKLKPDSFIVFTAHYDHLGQMGKKTYFPGANDNASGIAVLINLMKYFTAHPADYSILFIATSAEELGLGGSIHYVRYPLFDLDKIKFLINFDLAGTGEEGITVVNASVFKDAFQKLRDINNNENLLPDIKSRGEACISDHCPFYRQGVPCFYIYTLGGSKAYHDIYDKADALSLAAFENYVKLIIKFTEAL